MAVAAFFPREVNGFDEEEDDANQVWEYLDRTKKRPIVRELSCDSILSDSHIPELDQRLRRSNSLHTLKLPNNRLTSTPALASLLEGASPTLKELDLSDNLLNDKGLQALLPSLLELHHLHTLNLSTNPLGPKGAAPLAVLLRQSTQLTHLVLNKNRLGRKGLKTLAPSLAANKTLRHLVIGHNDLQDSGARVLAPLLDPEESDCRWETLDVTFNKIGPNGLQNMVGAVLSGNNRSLQRLVLDMNRIGGEDNSIQILLQYSPTIVEVSLSRNDMGDEGVQSLCDGFHEAHQNIGASAVTRLNLDWNSIHDVGAACLADLLKNNFASLVSLHLESNGIGDTGAKALANALGPNLSLKELNLVGNQIRDAGAIALAEQWCRSGCLLEDLKWEKNCMTTVGEGRLESARLYRDNRRTWLGNILRLIEKKKTVSIDMMDELHGDDEVIAVADQLAKFKPKVHTMHLGGKDVTARGMKHLCKVILERNVVHVRRLYICRAQMGDVGAAALAQSLLSNHSLRVLSIVNCGVGVDGARYLANALQRNHFINRLDLSDNEIQDRGAQDISLSICEPPHPSLIALNMSGNKLTDQAVMGWTTLSLEDLNLGNNKLTDRAALDLSKAAMDSKTFRWLCLRGNRKVTERGIRTLELFMPTPNVIDH